MVSSDADAGSPLPADLPMAQALLNWYGSQRRDLPWRRTRDPYHIWVSEVMLQQTQVNTVLPYYERFLARFPSVAALAAAGLDEVLAVWQGLGYYGRARSLHRAAREIEERYGGHLPASRAELLALPGIGHYTAGAILSIAFGQDEVALDGNVIRVLARVFDYDGDPTRAVMEKALAVHARALLPAGRAGEFNQALMELGATICLPRTPHCLLCPWVSTCRAQALGVQTQRPPKKPRTAIPHRTAVAAVVERDGRLLVVRRRPEGLLGGLWELPNFALPADEMAAKVLDAGMCTLGLSMQGGRELGSVRHIYTHFSLTLHVWRCETRGSPLADGSWDACRWLATGEVADVGLAGVSLKALALAGWEGTPT